MRTRTALYSALLVLSAVLIGCPQQVRIRDLTSNPSRYSGKEVTVLGTVISNIDIFGSGAFQLDDGSDKIWVLSENYGVPAKGVKVAVTGRVSEGINLGGQSLALVLRQTQKPHY